MPNAVLKAERQLKSLKVLKVEKFLTFFHSKHSSEPAKLCFDLPNGYFLPKGWERSTQNPKAIEKFESFEKAIFFL